MLNLKQIKLFIILFVMNIFIYGKKIFFYSLSSDDYYRFYTGGDEQVSYLGRWAATLINQYIFTGPIHILPYLNGLIGILSLTLTAFYTAKFFEVRKPLEIGIVTFLISATPMFAHNLVFNTNISLWISTLLGVYGIILIYNTQKSYKVFGFILLVISIGCYQTIIQVVLAMIAIKSMITVLNNEHSNIKEWLYKTFAAILLIVFAFFVSHYINYIYLTFHDLEPIRRFQKAMSNENIAVYGHYLYAMYSKFPKYWYFQNIYTFLFATTILLSMVTSALYIFQSKKKFSLLTILIVFYLSIPLIVNLVYIAGVGIPLRAHYTIGWFIAGIFILQMKMIKNSQIKIITIILYCLIILVNIFYINIFFDAAYRQTQSDILRANLIVDKIQSQLDETKKKLKFRIVGKKPFPVRGFYNKNQASNSSKYGIYKNFTNLNFILMNDKEYKAILQYIVKNKLKINAFPWKNSIIVYQDKIVLFMNPKKMYEKTSLHPRIIYMMKH